MLRADVDIILAPINSLIVEIDNNVPQTVSFASVKFRADLAGLLVVAIAAAYENCVKEILYEHTGRHHAAFESYARRKYEKINSKISIDDLKAYCALLDPVLKSDFKTRLTSRKAEIDRRTGINIEGRYAQLLTWRHEFAHTGVKNTTLEDAAKAHTFAKRVLYVFAETLN